MFKKNLQASLQRIFGIEKTVFESPDTEAPEQDCLFIEITLSRPRIYGKDKISCKVTGVLILFSQDERLTYGFFAKRLEQALLSDRRKFIFGNETDIPDSPARLQNIHERQVPFTFLYDSQYDPDRGEIDSINLSLDMED